jgi:hypothetical protein
MFDGAIAFETTPEKTRPAEVGRYMAGHEHA